SAWMRPARTTAPACISCIAASGTPRSRPPLPRRVDVPSTGGASARLLIQPNDVSPWVAEARRNLRRIRADRLHDLTAVGDYQIKCGCHAIDHDVHKKSGRRSGRPPRDPRAAHLAHRVIKGGVPVASFPQVPAEDALIKFGRAPNVSRRHLDVADLAVC